MGPLIILSGPSGSGKSTIIRKLLEEKAWSTRLSVSVTTRRPRPGEVDGVDYHFWTKEKFEAEVAAGGFLEWAEVYGNYYGTLRSEVQPHREQGLGVLLDIDVKGRAQVVQKCPDAVSIFVRTSSADVMEKRLRARKTETETSLAKRLAEARTELARAGEYDYQVINDDLEKAMTATRAIVQPLLEPRTK